MMDMN